MKKISLYLMLFFLYFLSSETVLSPIRAETTTQGKFAVHLVNKLGLAKDIDEKKAIDLLSSISIKPAIPPGAKWEKDKPATDKFVTQIQASIQMLLKEISIDLNIPPPPTLNLFIFEIPPAPQQVYFPKEGVSSSKPPMRETPSVPPDINKAIKEPTSVPPPMPKTPPDPPDINKPKGSIHK